MTHYHLIIHRRDGSHEDNLCDATGLDEACSALLDLADNLSAAPVRVAERAVVGVDLCDPDGSLVIGIGIIPGTPLAGAAGRIARRA